MPVERVVLVGKEFVEDSLSVSVRVCLCLCKKLLVRRMGLWRRGNVEGPDKRAKVVVRGHGGLGLGCG